MRGLLKERANPWGQPSRLIGALAPQIQMGTLVAITRKCVIAVVFFDTTSLVPDALKVAKCLVI